jgi:hypothetical protein
MQIVTRAMAGLAGPVIQRQDKFLMQIREIFHEE